MRTIQNPSLAKAPLIVSLIPKNETTPYLLRLICISLVPNPKLMETSFLKLVVKVSLLIMSEARPLISTMYSSSSKVLNTLSLGRLAIWSAMNC